VIEVILTWIGPARALRRASAMLDVAALAGTPLNLRVIARARLDATTEGLVTMQAAPRVDGAARGVTVRAVRRAFERGVDARQRTRRETLRRSVARAREHRGQQQDSRDSEPREPQSPNPRYSAMVTCRPAVRIMTTASTRCRPRQLEAAPRNSP